MLAQVYLLEECHLRRQMSTAEHDELAAGDEALRGIGIRLVEVCKTTERESLTLEGGTVGDGETGGCTAVVRVGWDEQRRSVLWHRLPKQVCLMIGIGYLALSLYERTACQEQLYVFSLIQIDAVSVCFVSYCSAKVITFG